MWVHMAKWSPNDEISARYLMMGLICFALADAASNGW